MSNQLALAKELVDVLEVLEELQTRRDELVGQLAGSADKLPVRAPKATKGKAKVGDKVTWPDGTEAEVALVEDVPPERTTTEILADTRMGGRTPEEQAKVEAEAMSAYEANVEPATESQKKMMFGILGKQFGIKDDAEMKAVIIAIVAKKHHGEKIQSISKELSKQWAGDVIDYLLKATNKEITSMIEPF